MVLETFKSTSTIIIMEEVLVKGFVLCPTKGLVNPRERERERERETPHPQIGKKEVWTQCVLQLHKKVTHCYVKVASNQRNVLSFSQYECHVWNSQLTFNQITTIYLVNLKHKQYSFCYTHTRSLSSLLAPFYQSYLPMLLAL